jgi:CelD/BcsL family acetyltransferase involved in cellulose biosynthesis
MKFTTHTLFLDPSYAPEWNALLAESITNAPFLRYEYLSTWWQTLGGGEWKDASLALVTAHDGDDLIGIAPLFKTTNRDGQPALMLLGSIEISDHLDLITRPGDLPRFVGGLLDHLNPQAWSVLDWYNLPDNSPTLPVLNAEAENRGWSYNESVYQPTPYIPLPGDFEQYLAGIDKKQRHEIRRKVRRAEESGRNVRWYFVDDENNLDSEIEGFLALMSNDPEKAAFLSAAMREQMRASVHAAFRAGWLQLAFFEVDGVKAAGYLNFDYANRIWVYNSGLDRQFNELSPGWVLLAYLLEWANINKRAEFDFLRGEEDYKYKFGGQNRFVQRVKVSR